MIRNRARLLVCVVPVAFDVGDRRGRVVVAVQDGGEHAEVVLGGPALVRFPVRVVGDDVGVVGSLAAAHHHVQRLSRGGVGDQAAGGGDGAALRGVHGAGVAELHVGGHVGRGQPQFAGLAGDRGDGQRPVTAAAR